MASPIPPAIERVILTYLSSRPDDKFLRAELQDALEARICSEISVRLGKYAGCMFIKARNENRDRILLCNADEIPDLIRTVMREMGVISFIFDKGSLTFSADTGRLDGDTQIHLVAKGVFIDEVIDFIDQYGGVIY